MLSAVGCEAALGEGWGCGRRLRCRRSATRKGRESEYNSQSPDHGPYLLRRKQQIRRIARASASNGAAFSKTLYLERTSLILIFHFSGDAQSCGERHSPARLQWVLGHWDARLLSVIPGCTSLYGFQKPRRLKWSAKRPGSSHSRCVIGEAAGVVKKKGIAPATGAMRTNNMAMNARKDLWGDSRHSRATAARMKPVTTKMGQRAKRIYATISDAIRVPRRSRMGGAQLLHQELTSVLESSRG
jgi:hypothetical protein